MITKTLWFWIAGIIGFSSCECASKKRPPKSETSASDVVQNVRPPMSLGEELAFERDHRPTGTPRAEALLASAVDAGISFSSQQQSLGRMQKAAFCMNARTSAVYLAVCEYENAGDTAAGAAVTNQIFKSMPGSSQHTNLKTVLSISQLDGKDDESKKIIVAFDALKP
jgi:hypothetical protein